VRRHVTLPGCVPSSRRTTAPRSCGALGPLMPRARRRRARTACEHRPSRRGTSCAGNEVHRRVASRRAPDLQVAAPGTRGEAARALGTAVARACHRALKAGRRPAEPHGRPPRRAGVSGRLSTRARRRCACTCVWSRASSREFLCR
jgi:hypothetical protein